MTKEQMDLVWEAITAAWQQREEVLQDLILKIVDSMPPKEEERFVSDRAWKRDAARHGWSDADRARQHHTPGHA